MPREHAELLWKHLPGQLGAARRRVKSVCRLTGRSCCGRPIWLLLLCLPGPLPGATAAVYLQNMYIFLFVFFSVFVFGELLLILRRCFSCVVAAALIDTATHRLARTMSAPHCGARPRQWRRRALAARAHCELGAHARKPAAFPVAACNLVAQRRRCATKRAHLNGHEGRPSNQTYILLRKHPILALQRDPETR